MKNLFYLLIGACISSQVAAQTNLDSLYSVWEDQSQTDSIRTQAYKEYIWNGFLFSYPDSAFELAEQLIVYANQNNYEMARAMGFSIQGITYFFRADYLKALQYYDQALVFYEKVGDQRGIANALNNTGLIYQEQGSLDKALEYFERCLEAREKQGDSKGVAATLSNMGIIYHEKGDFTKALDSYFLGLEEEKKTGNKLGIAQSLGGIGNVYMSQEDFPKAMDHFMRAIALFEKLGDEMGMARAQINIGIIHKTLGNYPEALDYCQRSLIVTERKGYLNTSRNACTCLYDTYKLMGESNEALFYLEKRQEVEDSLSSDETAKKLQQIEFEKQAFADSLANAEEARLVEEAHKEEVRNKNKTRNALIGGGLFLFLIAGAIYSRLRYTRKAKAEIEKEKDRSENLLLNILPADIAAELKEKGRADARDFEMVSILFTDFKGFTAASEKLSSQELVSEINTCFEAFDGIMGKYGIEKIKTIGDAYMAAGGLPVPTDDSVENTVLAAMEMQTFISVRKAKLDAEGNPGFEMRVGVHTGPVVAGIVGVKKFQYDIWGDTVNTASRMESSGAVGKVNISEATYELLKGDAQFSFESRGKIEAKGKGEMNMFFVSQKG